MEVHIQYYRLSNSLHGKHETYKWVIVYNNRVTYTNVQNLSNKINFN